MNCIIWNPGNVSTDFSIFGKDVYLSWIQICLCFLCSTVSVFHLIRISFVYWGQPTGVFVLCDMVSEVKTNIKAIACHQCHVFVNAVI